MEPEQRPGRKNLEIFTRYPALWSCYVPLELNEMPSSAYPLKNTEQLMQSRSY